MHIPDGIVPLPVVAAGYVLSGGLAWYSIRRIRQSGNHADGVARAALLTAAFFTLSAVHLPLPPTSVHLVLNGLMGILLGWYAFPAILVGLFFQAVLFGHGGITTLGINGVIVGMPALVSYGLFHVGAGRSRAGYGQGTIFGFLAGAVAPVLSVLLFVAIVLGTLPAELSRATEIRAVTILAAAYVPLVLFEGVLAALVVAFISRIRPTMLRGV